VCQLAGEAPAKGDQVYGVAFRGDHLPGQTRPLHPGRDEQGAGAGSCRFASDLGKGGGRWKWLLKVSPGSGGGEHLVKRAVLVHLPCAEAVELLVMVCICSSEQAVGAGSLHKFANSCADLWKKNPPKVFEV